MRKVLLVAGLAAALAFSFVPAQADPFCHIEGTETNDGSGRAAHCSFTPEAGAPAHGYLALTPNDWRIYADMDGDGAFDEAKGDKPIANGGYDSFNQAGTFFIPEGATKIDVDIYNGCAGPACGWVGAFLAG